MLKLMILLIILGSGVGTAPAAAAAACPACPAAPRLAELASQFCFPLGMIYVSIPRVKPVPSIYRYLRVTVPKVSGLWYTTICDTCNLYLRVPIISGYSFMSVFIRILLYRTYLLCLYFFYLHRLCFVRILYTVIPDPFGAAQSQFPEVVFVSIECFAMRGGGASKRSKYLCSTSPYVQL